MKICSSSLVLRVMQIKYHAPATWITKIKNTDSSRRWCECRVIGNFIHCCWKVELENILQYPLPLSTCTLYDLEDHFFGYLAIRNQGLCPPKTCRKMFIAALVFTAQIGSWELVYKWCIYWMKFNAKMKNNIYWYM